MRAGKKQIVRLTALVAIALAAVAWWPTQTPQDPIAFHRVQMEQAHAAHYAMPDGWGIGLIGYTHGDEYENFEFHRSRLIELGAVLELNYKFQHLLSPTDESEHFAQFILSDDRPNCVEFSSPIPHVPEPMQLTVWCHPEHKSAWDALIASRDVGDYRQTFME